MDKLKKITFRIFRWLAVMPFRFIGNGLYKFNILNPCVRYYSLAIKLYPWNYLLYYKRARALKLLERYHEALEDLEYAMYIYNATPDLYQERAHVYFSLEDYKKSLLDLDHLIKEYPKHKKAHYNRGNVHATMGNYLKAIHDFIAEIELYGESVELLLSRCACRFNLDEFELAVADTEKVLALEPDNEEALAKKVAAL